MDLNTTYLGLKLKNPLVVSASPLSQKVETVREMEKAGAGAVVLYSLFEEQIIRDELELYLRTTAGTESFAESLTYFPEPKEFTRGPQLYLEHIRKVKQAVDIPVIASLNGYTVGGWTKYAKQIEEAGADGLELNLYLVQTGFETVSTEVENDYLAIAKAVKSTVKIPVTVKLSPYFSALANMAKRLDESGVDGLTLFNRFYQPDIDLEELEVVPSVVLSTPQNMRLPMRWVAILHSHVKASLAATGGIHEGTDVLKMLMAGADVTMLCATLYKNGVGHISKILGDMTAWMNEHEYESVSQMRGSMSQKSCPNPEAFERGIYVKAVKSGDWLAGLK